MKNRRKRDFVSWRRFFWCTLFVVIACVLCSGFFFFSTFRIFFGDTFHPVLGSTWKTAAMEAVSGEVSGTSTICLREAVVLPDQTLFFLKYPPPVPLFTKEDFQCLYSSAKSSQPPLKEPPSHVDSDPLIVRCRASPRGYKLSLVSKLDAYIKAGPTYKWNSLVYEAMIDSDHSTIVFVKGLNLRPERVSNASSYECVYGWDFRRPQFLLRSAAISVAQEIVRCRTPLSILCGLEGANSSIKVSIRVKGRGILHSVAYPVPGITGPGRTHDPSTRKQHEVCVCTMMRNGAKFLREWVTYHAGIGVQRWFIYDNNSEDDIDEEIDALHSLNYNITGHVWPWIKTQEAGFAHCAVRARDSCEWVGFIDVDEYLHLPSGLTLQDVIRNYSSAGNVGELRCRCHSFGPSGLKTAPPEGVTVGYTCRLLVPERHKSIVRPEALNSTLINVVHHFHLRDGYVPVNVDRGAMVINHYKYQVWEVFKEKFYRRVATYVVDWQNEENVGSKDRAPGLGTRAVEPPDWSSQFCEVRDTGLRDRVLSMFVDPKTHRLPWQETDSQLLASLLEQKKHRRRNRKHRGS